MVANTVKTEDFIRKTIFSRLRNEEEAKAFATILNIRRKQSGLSSKDFDNSTAIREAIIDYSKRLTDNDSTE